MPAPATSRDIHSIEGAPCPAPPLPGFDSAKIAVARPIKGSSSAPRRRQKPTIGATKVSSSRRRLRGTSTRPRLARAGSTSVPQPARASSPSLTRSDKRSGGTTKRPVCGVLVFPERHLYPRPSAVCLASPPPPPVSAPSAPVVPSACPSVARAPFCPRWTRPTPTRPLIPRR